MFELLFKYSRPDYLRSELVYLGEWPAWLLVTLVAVAVAAIGALLFRRRTAANGYQLAVVGALQIGMLAVVVWALMQPNLATNRLRDGENAVALVLDASQSMAYGTSENRFRVAARELAAVLQAGDAPELDVRHYELGASAEPVISFVDSAPDAGETSLTAALTAVLDEARFSPLAAVVVASDGADTAGGPDAQDLAKLAAYGIPVHTIGVGRDVIPEDLELAAVSVPATVQPGSTVSALVSIRHDAPADATIKVYDGEELLAVVPAELAAETSLSTVPVELSLTEAGPHELSFTVDAGTPEPELRNNTRRTLVNVRSRQYRVLYFEGEPRWEYKFLRRAVGGDEDLHVATLLRVSPNKFYRQGIDTPDQLEQGFPTTRDELFAYDALLIGSVEAAFLTREQQEIVRDFVSLRGGSLLMLAGPSGLGNGGWGQSAIAEVLPASLPPSTANTFYRKKSPVFLTPQGSNLPSLRFDADDDANLAAWAGLPEIADYQLVGDPKPAALTYLTAETESGRVPLLLTQSFGKGQAWILATGGTWRWQMSMPLEDMKHETFWRQLLRAVVGNTPEGVSLVAEREAAGNAVALRAEFRDDGFRPLEDITVTAVGSHESGESYTTVMQAGDEGGVFTTSVVPPLEGTWYFEALAERQGEPVTVARSSMLYESGQAEYFGFRRNSALLQRVSDATGGRHFEAGNLSGLADLLRYSSAGISETEYRSIWDAPAVFILLMLLKSGEWLLRRRWQTI